MVHVGDFYHHYSGAKNDVAVPQIGGAEIEITVLVHPASLQHNNVYRRDKTLVIVWNFAKIDRQVMHTPSIMHLAVVAREMHAEQMEMLALGVLVQYRARTHGDTRAEFHVLQFLFAQCQCQVERIGLAQGGTVVDPHAGLDHAGSLSGSDVACLVAGFTLGHDLGL